MRRPGGDIWKDDGPESYVRRAQILVRNAERTLKSLKVVKGFLRGPKRVREASGVGWLAVEEAVKALERSRGTPVEKLPRGLASLGQALAGFPEIDGSAEAELHNAYAGLHIAGYYEGIHTSKIIFDGLAAAKAVVRRVERRFGIAAPP